MLDYTICLEDCLALNCFVLVELLEGVPVVKCLIILTIECFLWVFIIIDSFLSQCLTTSFWLAYVMLLLTMECFTQSFWSSWQMFECNYCWYAWWITLPAEYILNITISRVVYLYIFLPNELCMHLTHCMYILTYFLLPTYHFPLTYLHTYHFFLPLFTSSYHLPLHFLLYSLYVLTFSSPPQLHAAHYPRIFPIQKTAAVQLQECKYFSNIFPSNFLYAHIPGTATWPWSCTNSH